MSVLRISLIALFILVAMVIVAPQSLRAQGLTVGSIARFDQAVEIPGQVLPAGTYAFVERGSSVVEIWDKDQIKLIATLLTNEAVQPTFAERHEFEFEKSESGKPLELKSWFFDSGSLGHEFIYQK
jgi:hypothetical protein